MALVLCSLTMKDTNKTKVEKAYLSLWLNKYFSKINCDASKSIFLGENKIPGTIEELLVKVIQIACIHCGSSVYPFTTTMRLRLIEGQKSKVGVSKYTYFLISFTDF